MLINNGCINTMRLKQPAHDQFNSSFSRYGDVNTQNWALTSEIEKMLMKKNENTSNPPYWSRIRVGVADWPETLPAL